MRRVTLFAIVFALCGTGLIAQDDLAQYQEHMKAVQAANGAMRKAMMEKDKDAVVTNANNIATQFDWIAKYSEGKGKADGVTFAKNSGAAAKAIADATSPEDMMAASQKLGPTCNACHMVYRAGSAFKGM